MLTETMIPQIEEMTIATCPRLSSAADVGDYFPAPCTINVCRADPLRRQGPRDLPLTCQADWCLSGDYRRCPYWRWSNSERISLISFILRQMHAVCAVCVRALQA